jgi:hypothetical protein
MLIDVMGSKVRPIYFHFFFPVSIMGITSPPNHWLIVVGVALLILWGLQQRQKTWKALVICGI